MPTTKLLIMIASVSAFVLFIFYIYKEGENKGKNQEVEKITKKTINLQNETVNTKNKQQEIINTQSDDVESRVEWLQLVYEKGDYSSSK